MTYEKFIESLKYIAKGGEVYNPEKWAKEALTLLERRDKDILRLSEQITLLAENNTEKQPNNS